MPTSPYDSPQDPTCEATRWDLGGEGLTSWARALVGTTLDGRYRLEQVLGQGATGAVFRGTHLAMGRPVAIKVLHEALRAEPRSWARFQREVKGAARLGHPNCVEIIDLGTGQDGYFVMPFVQGRELATAIHDGLPLSLSLRVFDEILAGLEHAHAQGVIHRDIKPENILLVEQPGIGLEAKLIDFGIAKLDAPADETGPTLAGEVFGTPQYMSPEQTRGDTVTHRTDLYSAGLVFYEMLTGRPAFEGDDPFELMRRQLIEPPPPLPGHLPLALGPVLERLLAKDPAERFADATRARAELRRVVASVADAPPPLAAPLRSPHRPARRPRRTRRYASRTTRMFSSRPTLVPEPCE